MYRSTIRRATSIVATAAILASLSAATVAAPSAAAEKVTCRGKVATIVGTQGPDVLVGTNGRDIIAGLGGNDVIKGLGGHDLICAGRGADRVKGNQGSDRIYGNAGPDKLFGGKGPDKLFGGVSDDLLKGQKGGDALDGGPGTDTCYQNQGTGSETSCELPAAVVVPPVEKPTVIPPGPTPIPLDGILAVAYTDLNGDHVYDTGDVLIAKLADTDPGGFPSIGDTVIMGRYPTSLDPAPADFGDWNVTSHPVERVATPDDDSVAVGTAGGDRFSWSRHSATTFDEYAELEAATSALTSIGDQLGSLPDNIDTDPSSPSQPNGSLHLSAAGTGDDRLIDVELNYVVP